jgi:hypothetical protein
MRISFVQPNAELAPYIESFWVFESSVGMPQTDRSIAAPNGYPKLINPYENGSDLRRLGLDQRDVSPQSAFVLNCLFMGATY